MLWFQGAGLIPVLHEAFSSFLYSPSVNSLFWSSSLVCVSSFPQRLDSASFHHLLSPTMDLLIWCYALHMSSTSVLYCRVKSVPPSPTPHYCFLPESEMNTSVGPYTREHRCSIVHGLYLYGGNWSFHSASCPLAFLSSSLNFSLALGLPSLMWERNKRKSGVFHMLIGG